MKTTISTDLLMRPIAEFSMAQRVGDLVVVGATAGTDAARVLQGYAPGRVDPAAQTASMMRNMATALDLLGGRMDQVVRFKAYIDDWRDGAACAAEIDRALPQGAARATVGSCGFPLPQAVIEAELWAVVDGGAGLFHCTVEPAGLPLDIEAQARA